MMPKNEYVQKLVPIQYIKVTFVKDYKDIENYTCECLNLESFVGKTSKKIEKNYT